MGRSSIIDKFIGKKIGGIKILQALDIRDGRRFVKCKCLHCQKEFEAKFHNVYKGGYKSCGCLQHAIGNLSPKWKGKGEISASIFSSLKRGAKSKGLSFNVSLEDLWNLFLQQDRKCALSGCNLNFPNSRLGSATASLDRIDPSIGYELKNLQWVHKDLNYMKQSMTNVEFLGWINKVNNHYINKPNMNRTKTFNNNKGVVIITGISGQDASYMVEYLLKNTDYNVLGTIRTSNKPNLDNVKNLLNNERFKVVNMDLSDSISINEVIRIEKPSYFINLASLSFVPDSWSQPSLTMKVNAESLIHILEAVREYCPECRVYSAGTSEQLADSSDYPQNENSYHRPKSIYGVSKNAAEEICRVYQGSYGLYVVHGILYNHESERRPERFVTRKITQNVARIYHSIKDGNFDFEPLELGNIDAKRDWSHALDFVRGIWMMLNQDKYSKTWDEKAGPKNYILSSNQTQSVRYFVEQAFLTAGIEGCWLGKGVDEEYSLLNVNGELPNTLKGRKIVLMKVNPKFYRPFDVNHLHGDCSFIKSDLGWKPEISFEELVSRMVKNDILLTNK